MSQLPQGVTYSCSIAGIPTAQIDNAKLFIYVGSKNNIIQKFSIQTITDFDPLTPSGDDYTFIITSANTAKSVGQLKGELMLFYSDGSIDKGDFDLGEQLALSVSKREESQPTS